MERNNKRTGDWDYGINSYKVVAASLLAFKQISSFFYGLVVVCVTLFGGPKRIQMSIFLQFSNVTLTSSRYSWILSMRIRQWARMNILYFFLHSLHNFTNSSVLCCTKLYHNYCQITYKTALVHI